MKGLVLRKLNKFDRKGNKFHHLNMSLLHKKCINKVQPHHKLRKAHRSPHKRDFHLNTFLIRRICIQKVLHCRKLDNKGYRLSKTPC